MKIVNTQCCLDDYLDVIGSDHYTDKLEVKISKERKAYCFYQYVELRDDLEIGDLENLLTDLRKINDEVELILAKDNLFDGELYIEIYDSYRE